MIVTVGKILGALGVVANILIYQQKDRTRLLISKLTADCLWLFHYLALGAFSGAGITVIALVRSCVFLKEKPEGARGRRLLAAFWAAGLLSTVLTWKGPASLLPMAASLTAIFSFWRGRPHTTRLLSLPIAACMMTYDFLVGSAAGVVNEGMTMLSALYGLLRIDRTARRTREQTAAAEKDNDAADSTHTIR